MELIHSLLLQAIEGESGAEAQYSANAIKAKNEGYPTTATLFTALSRAEAIHIANHQRALLKNGYKQPVPKFESVPQDGTTAANLESALVAEYEEFKEMYPAMRKRIQKKYAGNFEAKIALLSMKWAQESEANHHDLLHQALQQIKSGSDVTGGDYYLCSVCGNIHFGAPPTELCSVCGHDISFYTRILIEQ